MPIQTLYHLPNRVGGSVGTAGSPAFAKGVR